jgi:hypothetical protein
MITTMTRTSVLCLVLGIAGCVTNPSPPPAATTVKTPIAPLGTAPDGSCLTIADCAQAAVQAAQEASVAAAHALPVGSIIAWWPTTPDATVPAGWAVCDGTNGTPNLSGKFLSGVIKPSDVSDGHEQPTHMWGFSDHAHSVSGQTGIPNIGAPNGGKHGGDFDAKGDDHQHPVTGTTDRQPNIPPNVHVLFIMKVK